MDHKKIWQTALGELEVILSKANFTTWFRDTFIYSYDEEKGQLTIGVPNNFCKEWLEKKYNQQIFDTLKKLLNDLKKIDYKVTSQKVPLPKDVPIDLATEEVSSEKVDQFYLNSKYSFENFVVGSSNRLAYATSMAIVNKPGSAHNPFFVYGGVGLGKTHLIQAIGNEIKKKYPRKKIVYITCEQFTNEFIQSIPNNKTNQFKKKYRDADILLVDDVQFLSHKEGTQEEFFHTFNALQQSNRQIILTADRQPQALSEITKRLTSRFAGGMVADIKPPNYETRFAILTTKSKEKNFLIGQDVLEYIAQNIQSNIRELEGALNRVITQCEIYNTSPSLDVVTKILEDVLASNQKRVSTQKVFDTVANFFAVPCKDLLGERRHKELVYPRQIIMYLLRNDLGFSYPRIGKELGGKDHTTIMYGVGKIQKELAKNQQLQRELALIKEKLYL